MTRRSNRTIRAITDLMWKRDQMQMRAADALLSAFAPARKPRPASRTRRRTRAKRNT